MQQKHFLKFCCGLISYRVLRDAHSTIWHGLKVIFECLIPIKIETDMGYYLKRTTDLSPWSPGFVYLFMLTAKARGRGFLQTTSFLVRLN